MITADLADKLNLTAGDADLGVTPTARSSMMAVDRVVPRRGVAGYWTVDGRQQSYNVLVAPGTIASPWLAAPHRGGAGDSGAPEVIVRSPTWVVSSRERPAQQPLAPAMDAIVAPLGLRAVPAKETLLDLADDERQGPERVLLHDRECSPSPPA